VRDLEAVVVILQRGGFEQDGACVIGVEAKRQVDAAFVEAAFFLDGGMRTRIAKRKKHPTPEQREKAVREALHEASADTPTDVIARANGITPRTLYRYIKRGT